MEKHRITLNLLPIGYKGTVKEIAEDGIKKIRFLDLGLVKNTEVQALQRSPVGDPVAYYIRGAVIALRSEEASKIIIEI